MWKRLKGWFEEYDLLAICLMLFALCCVGGAIIGSLVTGRYDYEFKSLKERVDIMQEHIVECIDDSICEHYRFE